MMDGRGMDGWLTEFLLILMDKHFQELLPGIAMNFKDLSGTIESTLLCHEY